MKPYYQDDLVTLYNGRCEDVLPTLSLSGSVHLLTDPPYFKVKDNDWDNQWSKSAEFLDWMGDWLDLAKPHLSPDASVWVFASPELTSAVESVVASRFRVLNSVRWVKPQGWHMKADLGAARSFLSPWEGIILAEQDATDERSIHFEPLRAYMDGQREAAGKSIADLNEQWQAERNSRGQMAGHWFGRTQWQMPTALHYEFLIRAGVRLRPYVELVHDFEKMAALYDASRRPFANDRRDRSTDVFTFDTVAPYPGKHVCEKPAELLAHMIETTTRPGDTIIDCFAGSGAVLDVARQLGRKAVGIEMDAHWCRQISKRLSQQAFDLGDIA